MGQNSYKRLLVQKFKTKCSNNSSNFPTSLKGGWQRSPFAVKKYKQSIRDKHIDHMTCLFIIFLGNSQYSFKCLKICLNTRWLMLEGTFSTSKALSVNLIFYLTNKSRCFALQASLSLLSHFLSLCDHNPLYLGFPQERV